MHLLLHFSVGPNNPSMRLSLPNVYHFNDETILLRLQFMAFRFLPRAILSPEIEIHYRQQIILGLLPDEVDSWLFGTHSPGSLHGYDPTSLETILDRGPTNPTVLTYVRIFL